jgi:hypothetical protein
LKKVWRLGKTEARSSRGGARPVSAISDPDNPKTHE